MAQYVYPAVFHPNEDDGSITVTIPDLPGCITEGKNMAQDALSMWLLDAEDCKESIPTPTVSLQVEAPEFANLVYADTDAYRKKYDARAVKKTLSIPNWLNTMAEEAGVNFSQILQDALKARLNVQ